MCTTLNKRYDSVIDFQSVTSSDKWKQKSMSNCNPFQQTKEDSPDWTTVLLLNQLWVSYYKLGIVSNR